MKYQSITAVAISLLFSTASFGLTCPKNFTIINVGDSIQQVELQCGLPDNKVVTDMPNEGPQEWSYYIQQSSMHGANIAAGALKTQFAFDGQGKVINISVNGIGVASTSVCGRSVSLGDSRDSVAAACGKSTFINRETPQAAAPAPSTKAPADEIANKRIEWTYWSTPPVTLIFEDGKLTGSK